MRQRIALVQHGECPLFGALAALQDNGSVEWRPVSAADPEDTRAAMHGCDAALVRFDDAGEFQRTLQAAAAGLPPLVVDFSPIPAALFELKAQELARAGVDLIGAQTGGPRGRRLYADDALESRPVLTLLRLAADEIHFTGAGGSSKSMAAVERLLFAFACAASGEALSLAVQAGLEERSMRALLENGSGANDVIAAHAECPPAEALRAIDGGLDLARAHGHPLVLCAAAKLYHQGRSPRP